MRTTDGGWGLVPHDDASHQPISGEVAFALGEIAEQNKRVQAQLQETQKYFAAALETDEPPRSVVHLCWLVLGSFACGIGVENHKVADLLTLLEQSGRRGWSWPLRAGAEESHADAVYPTYMALLTISEARHRGWSGSASLTPAGLWLLSGKGEDQLWADPGAALAERVLESAYAILGLYYALPSDQFTESVAPSLDVLGHKALDLPLTDVIVPETPLADSSLPIWNHCVIPQVIWTRLRVSGAVPDPCDGPLPRLLSKCVDAMWRADDRTWLEPMRKVPSPYVAADVLRVMTAYSNDTSRRFLAPELAVCIATASQELRDLERTTSANIADLDQRLKASRYVYEWKEVGLNRWTYFGVVLGVLAFLALVAAFGPLGLSAVTARRIGAVVLVLAAYRPVAQAADFRTPKDRILLALGLIGVLAVLWVAADWGRRDSSEPRSPRDRDSGGATIRPSIPSNPTKPSYR